MATPTSLSAGDAAAVTVEDSGDHGIVIKPTTATAATTATVAGGRKQSNLDIANSSNAGEFKNDDYDKNNKNDGGLNVDDTASMDSIVRDVSSPPPPPQPTPPPSFSSNSSRNIRPPGLPPVPPPHPPPQLLGDDDENMSASNNNNNTINNNRFQQQQHRSNEATSAASYASSPNTTVDDDSRKSVTSNLNMTTTTTATTPQQMHLHQQQQQLSTSPFRRHFLLYDNDEDNRSLGSQGSFIIKKSQSPSPHSQQMMKQQHRLGHYQHHPLPVPPPPISSLQPRLQPPTLQQQQQQSGHKGRERFPSFDSVGSSGSFLQVSTNHHGAAPGSSYASTSGQYQTPFNPQQNQQPMSMMNLPYHERRKLLEQRRNSQQQQLPPPPPPYGYPGYGGVGSYGMGGPPPPPPSYAAGYSGDGAATPAAPMSHIPPPPNYPGGPPYPTYGGGGPLNNAGYGYHPQHQQPPPPPPPSHQHHSYPHQIRHQHHSSTVSSSSHTSGGGASSATGYIPGSTRAFATGAIPPPPSSMYGREIPQMPPRYVSSEHPPKVGMPPPPPPPPPPGFSLHGGHGGSLSSAEGDDEDDDESPTSSWGGSGSSDESSSGSGSEESSQNDDDNEEDEEQELHRRKSKQHGNFFTQWLSARIGGNSAAAANNSNKNKSKHQQKLEDYHRKNQAFLRRASDIKAQKNKEQAFPTKESPSLIGGAAGGFLTTPEFRAPSPRTRTGKGSTPPPVQWGSHKRLPSIQHDEWEEADVAEQDATPDVAAAAASERTRLLPAAGISSDQSVDRPQDHDGSTSNHHDYHSILHIEETSSGLSGQESTDTPHEIYQRNAWILQQQKQLMADRETLLAQWEAQQKGGQRKSSPKGNAMDKRREDPSLQSTWVHSDLQSTILSVTKSLRWAEAFVSNLPLTIGAIALSFANLGVVWFKFTEELVSSCERVHFHSSQCSFPEFPGCFYCDTSNPKYRTALIFHESCSAIAGAITFMFFLKLIFARRVVFDELGSPTTAAPAGLICMTCDIVFAGRGLFGQVAVITASSIHLCLAVWFIYMTLAYHIMPDPSWFPNTVSIGISAIKTWLYYPMAGHFLMAVSLSLFFLFFPISVIRVAVNRKISATVGWMQMSAPDVALYALTLMAQPSFAEEHPDVTRFQFVHRMVYLPCMHFLFAMSITGMICSVTSLVVRWKDFSKLPFSPAHAAFCAPSLSHANAIQAYWGALDGLSTMPPGSPLKILLFCYWVTVLVAGTVVTLVIAYKFACKLPEWTHIDTTDEIEPPQPSETAMIATHLLSAGETLVQPFVSPAILQANETGALVVSRDEEGNKVYRRTRKVTALGFEPIMTDLQMDTERELLLEYVARNPPRRRHRTLSVPGSEYYSSSLGTGNSGVFSGQVPTSPWQQHAPPQRRRANTSSPFVQQKKGSSTRMPFGS